MGVRWNPPVVPTWGGTVAAADVAGVGKAPHLDGRASTVALRADGLNGTAGGIPTELAAKACCGWGTLCHLDTRGRGTLLPAVTAAVTLGIALCILGSVVCTGGTLLYITPCRAPKENLLCCCAGWCVAGSAGRGGPCAVDPVAAAATLDAGDAAALACVTASGGVGCCCWPNSCRGGPPLIAKTLWLPIDHPAYGMRDSAGDTIGFRL